MPQFQAPQQPITTKQLAALTAGGDDYIRTKGNDIKALALRLDLNPEAPEVVAFGTGPRIVARAHRFLQSGASVPAFVKRGVNAWEYLGHYRATAIRTDSASIRRHASNRDLKSVSGVLFLEAVGEPQVRVFGGGFADAETRSEIEKAAVDFVIRELEARGFLVQDRQRENRGYDLHARSSHQQILVEVKGTDAETPRFFLSRNEWKCGQTERDWRLYLVCSARSSAPVLHTFTAAEAAATFNLDPLAWECTAK